MPAAPVLKPKTEVGGGHDGPRKAGPGRPPKNKTESAITPEFASAYEQTRIEELRARAGLYRLKLKRMEAELLDRKTLLVDIASMQTAIREVILGSKLSPREKADCLRNLIDPAVLLENAAKKQQAAEKDEVETKNGHSDLN